MSNPKELLKKTEEVFNRHFKSVPSFYKAPGRINLIGEHTDYNDGFVLPASIDKAIYFAVAKNNNGKLRFYSTNYEELFESDANDIRQSKVAWANYLLGVLAQFEKKGFSGQGIDCAFGGDIPYGAGLSSSAALECGFALCVNNVYAADLDRKLLALMAQKAEHEFAGVMCGIMDQFTSLFGKQESVIKLDCRDLNYEYYPFNSADIDIVLCDTRVKHSLASSEYNQRRAECEKGVSLLKERHPEVKSLRDAGPEMLETVREKMNATVYARCSYVIEEIRRVENACKALLQNDFTKFGKLMFETHNGLSRDYGVSCKELDVLADIAGRDGNVLGARMMGGGFGGCTINLVKRQGTDRFINDIKSGYSRATGIETDVFTVQISEGAGKII